jgi:hypothetical protein
LSRRPLAWRLADAKQGQNLMQKQGQQREMHLQLHLQLHLQIQLQVRVNQATFIPLTLPGRW